jgi:anti-anti-sigma factor
VGGWLDAQNEGRLVEAIRKAKDEGAEYVLLELGDLVMITSAGIRAFQQAYKILTPRNEPDPIRRLKLCCASPSIFHVLSVTGLLVSVPMYEDTDIAVDSFGK